METSEIRTAWSPEAEHALLGCLLQDGAALARVDDLISVDSFFDRRHGAAFAAIATLVAANRPTDPVSVFSALRDRDQVDDEFNLDHLRAMAETVPSPSNARRYAEVVADRAAHRRLLAEAKKALDIAGEPGCPFEKLDRISAAFVALERGQQRRSPQRVGDLLAAALERYDALAGGRAEVALSTGIAPLDRVLAGGLRPGRLYGIAARPSVGKSSVARTVLLHVARAGAPVLLLSQEMPADELVDALMAEAGRIDGERLQTGNLDDEDWTRMSEAAETLSALPLHVDDQGGLTLAQIRAKARQVKGLRVLALDYLQLCSSTLRGKSTNDEVAEISRGLKALALEMQIPVIMLSQLNREVERRADKEPQLSDLRDSGAIEQDVDVAVLLWTVREDEESRLVGWKVPKHRGGRKARFGMRYQPAINQWRDSDEPLRAPHGAIGESGGFR